MSKQRVRRRRSLLFSPASREVMCRKAVASSADGVIFDLEDAVADQNKESARDQVCHLLEEFSTRKKEFLVRVNSLSCGLGIEDIWATAPLMPDTYILPKASVQEVIAADTLLKGMEALHGVPQGRIGLIPLIETPLDVENVVQILQASPRICGVFLGAEDLTKELGIVRTKAGRELDYVRSRLVMAAHASGIDAIDTPFTDFNDKQGLEQDLLYARSIGMTAKAAIHPAQIEQINTAFTPTEEDVQAALKIVSAFRDALEKGLGAFSLEGKMIDMPIVERAKTTLLAAGIEIAE